jgi:hypothetical protein
VRHAAQPTVALAVSGHGFGHAVRCAEVASELLARGALVKLRTDAPLSLFPSGAQWIPSPDWPLDVGVAQHDGLDLDIDETRRGWDAFARELAPRAEAEAHMLREQGIDILLGDVPPLAFAASSRAGIPGAALGNFGWDWIYRAWPDFDAAVVEVQSAYAQADVLFRLPLHSTSPDAFPAFKAVEDVPLIARRAKRPCDEVRVELGLPMDRQIVLLSFGGFKARGLDIPALGEWASYTFVIAPPIALTSADMPDNVLVLDRSPVDFISLLGACDAVVTKPGYGIVADCLANRVAMLYTSRGPFREYDVLVDALSRLGRARYAPQDEVRAGHLGPHLDALLASDAVWIDQPMNGAVVVADRLLGRA